MKTKTSSLTGVALDWAVAKCVGIPAEDVYLSGRKPYRSLFRKTRDEDGNLTGSIQTGPELLFSRKWESGGPVIEREKIEIGFDGAEGGVWSAVIQRVGIESYEIGSTPLIAAMRCYVASKLGDEIEVPDELG